MSQPFSELVIHTFQNFQEGEIVRGRIVAVRPREVLIDIGYKSEGVLALHEFTDPSEIQLGNEIDVLFESFDDEQGLVLLSKKKVDRQRTWNDVLAHAHEMMVVDGKIFKKVRGGFMVDIGMEAFLPASLVDIKPVRNLDQFLGFSGKFMIVKINHKRRNIVVSRKDYLERERHEARRGQLSTLKIGQIVKGRVKNITDFGAFIDLGSLDGLLHITDISWGRVAHPSEVVKLGEDINVVVLAIDKEQGKVSLGIKQRLDDPWVTAPEKYLNGTRLTGKVVNILPYGAFVELENGVEGLVHISEFSWTKRISHPSEVVQVGDQVEVVILNLDPETRKISLGMKQAQENPWREVAKKFSVGDRVRGKVRNLTDFGAFVELEPGIDGLVHISDMSWTPKSQKPSDLVKKGDDVEVMVLSIDPEAQKISLGMKQFTDDPWQTLTVGCMPGTLVPGQVTRLANFGLFIQLENGLEGLAHISEIPGVSSKNLERSFQPGDRVTVQILSVENDTRKIALSFKDVPTSTGAPAV
jgi:small subunit ribosomal protein S1